MAEYSMPSDRYYYVPPKKAKVFSEEKADPKAMKQFEDRAKIMLSVIKDETGKFKSSK